MGFIKKKNGIYKKKKKSIDKKIRDSFLKF